MTVPPIWRAIDVVAENYATRKVAEEVNIFALKMVNQQNIERLGENMIISPFAVYQGLAQLLSGAMGKTSAKRARLRLEAARTPSTMANKPLACLHSLWSTICCSPPGAYEISSEFKQTLSSLYNNTVLTRIAVRSTAPSDVDHLHRIRAGDQRLDPQVDRGHHSGNHQQAEHARQVQRHDSAEHVLAVARVAGPLQTSRVIVALEHQAEGPDEHQERSWASVGRFRGSRRAADGVRRRPRGLAFSRRVKSSTIALS
jgi:hypothetical protein